MAGKEYYGGLYSPPGDYEMDPFSPDPQGHSHQGIGNQNPFVGSPYSPVVQKPDHTNSFSSGAPLLGSAQGLLQTRVPSLGEQEKERLSSDYSSRRQMVKLFWKMLSRFAISTACCGAIVAVFKVYELRGVLNSSQKHIFNAIYIAISMLLSMNLISAFKSLAGMIRWRLLAKYELTLREVDLILSLSSFQKTIELLFTRTIRAGSPGNTTTKGWAFRLGAIGWTLLGVAAQVGIALIGLTYNHDNSIGLKPGPIQITELQQIFSDPLRSDPNPSIANQKWAAHSFGIGSWTYPTYSYDSPESQGQEAGQHLIYQMDDTVIINYVFKEWAVSYGVGIYDMISTNRSVNVHSECVFYSIPEGKYGDANSAFVITTKEGVNTTVDWLKDSGPEQTVIANPFWEGISPEYLSCGTRCSPIYLFQFFEGKDGYLYNCTITVSEVYNAIDPVHQMPDKVAMIFAGSPGSEGWKDEAGRQFARYSQGSQWGAPTNPSGEEGEPYAAYNIGRFAAGSIAEYDYIGPMINTTGMQTWRGVQVVIKWMNLYITLGTILAINFVFGVFIVIKANAVYCKDDSFLSTARLLRPLLEPLGDSGSHLSGRQIADTYDNKVVYGYRRNVLNNIYHLDFGDNIKPLSPGQQFPDGRYN